MQTCIKLPVTSFLVLAVAQALWAEPLDEGPHGVHVSELNTDIDYRDFNETVDLAIEASKTPGIIQNRVATSESNVTARKNGTHNNTVFIRMEQFDFPISNITYDLRKDCRNEDCSTEGWLVKENISEFIILLSFVALALVSLIVMTTLKLKLLLMRSWGYSPELLDDRNNEIRMNRVRSPNTEENSSYTFFRNFV